MAKDVGRYEPAPRWGHLAAAVKQKLYLWGGMRRDVHDRPAKTAVASVVDVLDLQVKMKKKLYWLLVWLRETKQVASRTFGG